MFLQQLQSHAKHMNCTQQAQGQMYTLCLGTQGDRKSETCHPPVRGSNNFKCSLRGLCHTPSMLNAEE